MSLSFVFKSSTSLFEAVLVVVGLVEVEIEARGCVPAGLGDSIGRPRRGDCDCTGLRSDPFCPLLSLSIGDCVCTSVLSAGESCSLLPLVWLLPLTDPERELCCNMERRLLGLRAGGSPDLAVPFVAPIVEVRDGLVAVVVGGAMDGRPDMLVRLLAVIDNREPVDGGAALGFELIEAGREESCFVGDCIGDCIGSDLFCTVQ